VELLVVPGARRVFNFRNREQGELAWRATREWLQRFVLRRHAAGTAASGCKAAAPAVIAMS
jgi:hypothetical protein